MDISIQPEFVQLERLLGCITRLERKEDVFGLTWRISKATASLTDVQLSQLSYHNVLHMDAVFSVFTNEAFVSSVAAVMRQPFDPSDESMVNDVVPDKQLIQSFLRLAFFNISVFLPSFSRETKFFVKKHLGSSLYALHAKLTERGLVVSIRDILVALEAINYDRRYQFSDNIPEVIDTNFLNMNQIASRTILGSLLLYKIEDWVIPATVIGIIDGEGLKTNQLFRDAVRTRKKLSHYQNYGSLLRDPYFTEERRGLVRDFLYLLRDPNKENLTFLIAETGFYCDAMDRERFILQKIENAAYVREKVQSRFERLSVFTGDEGEGNWSNKVFLNTIRFLSVLESIRGSSDERWQVKVFNYFFQGWLHDLYENINYYRLREGDVIPIYVEGLSDKMILECAYRKLYPDHHTLVFYDCGSRHEVFKKINAVQVNDLGPTIFGVFDFDDAYNDFHGLAATDSSGSEGFGEIQGDDSSGLYRIRNSRGSQVFAILLPVPSSRSLIASSELGARSLLSLELLFEDSLLGGLGHLGSRTTPGGSVSCFVGGKIRFAERVERFSRDDFRHFEPLFDRIINLIPSRGDLSQNSTEKPPQEEEVFG